MVTDATLLEVARITGLPFDYVEQQFRGDKKVTSEANGNTFNRVSVEVSPNWGNTLYISNVTSTGSVVPDGHVCIRVGDAELMVKSVAVQRAITAVETGANLEEIDKW